MTAAAQTIPGYLTRKALAPVLNVSPRTLEGWESDHEGPVCFRVGREAFYAVTDVADWLAAKADQARKARAQHNSKKGART